MPSWAHPTGHTAVPSVHNSLRGTIPAQWALSLLLSVEEGYKVSFKTYFKFLT